MSNLEPCPECGGQLYRDYFDGNHDAPVIACSDCDYLREAK